MNAGSWEEQLETSVWEHICLKHVKGEGWDQRAGTPLVIVRESTKNINNDVNNSMHNNSKPSKIEHKFLPPYIALGEVEYINEMPDKFLWIPGTSLHVVAHKNPNHNFFDHIVPAMAFARQLNQIKGETNFTKPKTSTSASASSTTPTTATPVRMVFINPKSKRLDNSVSVCQWVPLFVALSPADSVVAVENSEFPICFDRLVLSWNSQFRGMSPTKTNRGWSTTNKINKMIANGVRDYVQISEALYFLPPPPPPFPRPNHFFPPSQPQQQHPSTPQILIYARSDAYRKILQNAHTIANFIQTKYPSFFTILHLDKHRDLLPDKAPHATQAQLWRNSHIVITPHGAFSAYAAFLPQNARLIEVCTSVSWFPHHLQKLIGATRTIIPENACVYEDGFVWDPKNSQHLPKYMTLNMTVFEEVFDKAVQDLWFVGGGNMTRSLEAKTKPKQQLEQQQHHQQHKQNKKQILELLIPLSPPF
eukprot:c11585_g2_i1.p1 GENE.c11585_g2_i1~~c11585_g2_i1.p1  ORF type:complete len:510 (-),score=138.92 c11585_g2_i1:243-1673(-)